MKEAIKIKEHPLMPDQKWCTWFNDKSTLNLRLGEAAVAHADQHYGAIARLEDRMERRQIRAQRRAAQLVALDGALVGACLMALAVLIWVGGCHDGCRETRRFSASEANRCRLCGESREGGQACITGSAPTVGHT